MIKIKDIEKAIKDIEEKKDMIAVGTKLPGFETTLEKERLPLWLQYESMRINLVTQREVLTTVKDTDKLTLLAYRIAWISLGASIVSLSTNIFT